MPSVHTYAENREKQLSHKGPDIQNSAVTVHVSEPPKEILTVGALPGRLNAHIVQELSQSEHR